MLDSILEAWRVNQRINRALLDAVSDEGLACTLSTRGGRTVARQLAHLHDNRLRQLRRRAKALAEGAALFGTAAEPGRAELRSALDDSAERIERMFRAAAAGEAGVRLMKRGPGVYLAYLVAHESHHRGSILLTLKQCGHAVDADVRMGLWDWDRI